MYRQTRTLHCRKVLMVVMYIYSQNHFEQYSNYGNRPTAPVTTKSHHDFQEGVSSQSVSRVRRFQRELEAAEDRAETAESNLSLIRAKHRTFVTTSSVPGSQVYLVQESRTAEI